MPLFLISWPVNPIEKYDFQSIIDQKRQCEITFAYPDGSQSTLYCTIIAWPTASSLRVESMNNLAAESNNMQLGALKLPNGDTVVFDTVVAQLPRGHSSVSATKELFGNGQTSARITWLLDAALPLTDESRRASAPACAARGPGRPRSRAPAVQSRLRSRAPAVNGRPPSTPACGPGRPPSTPACGPGRPPSTGARRQPPPADQGARRQRAPAVNPRLRTRAPAVKSTTLSSTMRLTRLLPTVAPQTQTDITDISDMRQGRSFGWQARPHIS
jgi:hypothetical protein